ncbi:MULTISPECIES: M14 family metallopeptidase [Olivibacter]|uniref:M14 metallopeptidase family protein n=1 Tax=Olivibacter jilunii TaxID=985016 RepID=A0ABW6AZD1_9SPHI|nr:M14 family metallopeptidase [Olivibacter sp. UJ_SKK_5.1]MDX3913690.1 M14 family metallopeptidase [Pseudosphingobacterium sp.]
MNYGKKRCFLFLLFLTVTGKVLAQAIPVPKSHFGFSIGDDYQLATYQQLEKYFQLIDKLSDRVQTLEIGKTEEGRRQYIWVISSPENLKKLSRYKEISQKMARAEDLSCEEAKKLAMEGKPVVWIDGGLHANETVGTHQLIETFYQLVSRNDAENKAILDGVIILLSQVNPDGQELMSTWYMQEQDPKKRNMHIPRLYQKYIGHDNNRDFFMMNMKESTHIARQQYIEWMPQIVYNHHQRGPEGSVLAGPPYRDPFNHVFDPLIITSIDGVAAAMNNRLNAENKPGYTRLSGSVFSTWWNGGLRTAPYFHNMIGILTEIIGNPTPEEVPVIPTRLIPNNATPNPVTPQTWHFRQSIDYSLSLNYAILNYAQRHGDELLYNIYLMGKNAIEKGSRDNWTLLPRYADSIAMAYKRDKGEKQLKGDTIPRHYYDAVLKNPAFRDARGYIIPADQSDFPTAVKFVNALIKSGVLIHKAKADFSVGSKRYPAGSYIVKTAQAFRAHVLDMFEPQDHPNDFQYPGGPPVKPYDAAGWTLAFQMGVRFDRITDAFDGPFEHIAYGLLQDPPVKELASSKQGYLLDANVNDSFTAVNDLLKENIKVYRTQAVTEGMPAGSFYVETKESALLQKVVSKYGVMAKAVSTKPKDLLNIKPGRIALFDYYGGSIPSGWVRWILEQFHFDFQLVYPKDIDKGQLHRRFDVILFIGGGMPPLPTIKNSSRYLRMPSKEEVPVAYHHMLGSLSVDKSIPQLRTFLKEGGRIVTVGNATNLAYHFKLPVENALSVKNDNGESMTLSGDKFYIPSSILTVRVDTTQTPNFGMHAYADVVFNNSETFRIKNEGLSQIKPLMWFDTDKILKSGWAWGQAYLKGGIAAFYTTVGKGSFYAFGPEITNRGQAHGTFKLLFNGLYK